ncbi:MAG TPA: presqualene diphosphate synthase HpnD [Geminicoccaceae bacterium]
MTNAAPQGTAAALETPSGKGAKDENFPVGSWLLPAAVRPHVTAFYDFVRAADDIADNRDLKPADKLARLGRLEQALTGPAGLAAHLPKAEALRASLAATGVSPRHALDLLAAFKRDATKLRYHDFPDLLGYCALSASPVGRHLLDLHGEASELYRLADPLCDALQLLNHLQDCQNDYRALDRVYLPLDSFAAAGIGVEALGAGATSPALRQVFDRVLDGVDELLSAAGELPRALRSRRLAAESAVILEVARGLAAELRRRDPLAERVELGRARFLLFGVQGLGRMFWLRCTSGSARARERTAMRRGSGDRIASRLMPARPELGTAEAHVRNVVLGSGTSFYWGMRLLPDAKRKAMYAIYAFCREVDDVADGTAPVAAKLEALAGWRREIDALFAGTPSRPTALALLDPIARFDLPAAEFHAMIDGMEMDAAGTMRAPPLRDLMRYCRCVAGAVGLLSIRVFEADGEHARRGALALAEALQLTNILRDLCEDAARGRLYLPRELLQQHRIAHTDPASALRDPGLPEVCDALAQRAKACFADAERHFKRGDRRQLRPALIMMHVYRRTLDRLIARGWRQLDDPVRLARPERLWLALRYGLL